MMTVMPGPGRLVVGTSGSPGSLPALRYAHDLARRSDALLVAVLAYRDARHRSHARVTA
jgi:nucleotide-binding universal stress UspA family protein